MRALAAAVSGHRPRWGRLSRVDVAFIGYCLVVAAFRFTVLVRPGAPAGIDGGNWLAFGHDMLGDRLRSSTIVYPPVVPVLVTAAVGLLGPVSGIAFVAASSALAPAAAVYVVLRRAALGINALLLAGLLAAAGATGEAAAWGGYPQLLASGVAIVFLLLLEGYLRSPGPSRALAAGTTLAATLATSHFVGLIAIVAGAVLVALDNITARDRRAPLKRQTLKWLPAVGLPCLPLVPLYLSLTQMLTGFSARQEPDAGWSQVVWTMRWVFRDLPAIWWPSLGFAIATPLLLRRATHDPLWRLTTSLLAAVGILLVATGEPRYVYVVPIVVVMALALVLRDPSPSPDGTSTRSVPIVAVLASVLIAQSVAGLSLFVSQRDFYAVLTPGVAVGVDWLRSNTPHEAIVAVSPVRDAPFGWWVEGLGRRRTLPGSALRWLNFQDERARARRANAIFESLSAQESPHDEVLKVASALGADFLFVNKAWHGYSHSSVERLRRSHPDPLVFENEDVLILRVRERA